MKDKNIKGKFDAYYKEIKEDLEGISIMKGGLLILVFVLYIDVKNIPSKFMSNQSPELLVVSIAIALLLVITFVFQLKFWELMKSPVINIIDKFIAINLIVNLMYTITILYLGIGATYKYGILLTEVFIIVLLRIYQYINNESLITIEQNVLDLKEICDNKIKIPEDEFFLLSDTDVNYDLLNRDKIINSLFQTIVDITPINKNVISLEGPWGSGKTTMLNCVNKLIDKHNAERNKEKEREIIIIKDFDPWNYANQESLFLNMLDSILKNTGISYSEIELNKTKKKFQRAIFGGNDYLGRLSNLLEEDSSVEEIKNKMNKHLKKSNKKIVFVIDNIERLDSESVILLFKLVGNILDLNGITYVLSFDSKKIKTVFDNRKEYEYEYLKKIIQTKIQMPALDTEKLKEVYQKCLANINDKIVNNKSELGNYDLVLEHLCSENKNIRDFKRYVNSVICLRNLQNNSLNKEDLLIINYIRIENIVLYNTIFENEKFFLGVNDSGYENISIADRDENFFNATNSFFENLFKIKENKSFRNILVRLFPVVEIYTDRNKLEKLMKDKNKWFDKMRICDSSFFKLYSTATTNYHVELEDKARKLVEVLNSDELDGVIVESFKSQFLKVKEIEYEELLERIGFKLSELNEKGRIILFSILYDGIEELEDKYYSKESTKERALLIMVNLLNVISEEWFSKFVCEKIKDGYNKLEIISELRDGMKDGIPMIITEKRYEIIDEILNSKIRDVLDKGINLYEDGNYVKHNIFPVFRLEEDSGKLKKYIKKVLNTKSVFKILYDTVGRSKGASGYRYYIDKNIFEKAIDKNDVEQVLKNIKNIKNINKSQTIIYNLYELYYKNPEGYQFPFTENTLTYKDKVGFKNL